MGRVREHREAPPRQRGKKTQGLLINIAPERGRFFIGKKVDIRLYKQYNWGVDGKPSCHAETPLD